MTCSFKYDLIKSWVIQSHKGNSKKKRRELPLACLTVFTAINPVIISIIVYKLDWPPQTLLDWIAICALVIRNVHLSNLLEK